MRAIWLVAASLLLLCVPGVATKGQFGGMLGGSGQRGYAQPVYVNSTYVAQGGSTAVSSITSPALSITAGNFVAVVCRDGAGTGDTVSVTSSLTNTWSATTHYTASAFGGVEIFYANNAAGGSTTFTCHFASAGGYNSLIVLQYQVAHALTLDAQTGSSPGSTSTSYTTSAFSTTQPLETIVFCPTVNGAGSFSSVSIGALGGSFVQATAATPATSGANMACGVVFAPSAQSSITANMQFSVATGWIGALATFY